jgi:hypothetical protein
MDIDQEKLEHTVLALLYLTSFKDRFGVRAWKGHDWEVMNLLHEKGYISNPATKAKSVRDPASRRCDRRKLEHRFWLSTSFKEDSA